MIIPHSVQLTDEMAEILPDNTNIEEEVISEMTVLYFLSILAPIDQVIILLKMLGYKSNDAATVIGTSESYVSQRMALIRLFAKVLLGSSL